MNTTNIFLTAILLASCQGGQKDTPQEKTPTYLHGEGMLARGFQASTSPSSPSPHAGRTMAVLDIVPSAIEILDDREELIASFDVSMNFGEYETATVSYQVIDTYGETVTPWISLPVILAANGETVSKTARITVSGDGSYQVVGKVDLRWPTSDIPATFSDLMHFSVINGVFEGSTMAAFVAGPEDAPLVVGQPID